MEVMMKENNCICQRLLCSPLEMEVNFSDEISLYTSKGSLTCCKILGRGADGLTPPLKEVVLRIFIARKKSVILGRV
jgi:hypothetical protein